MPLEPITVVMPARNAAQTVAVAISSTLRALPPRSRILVHDDASTDETAAVARSVDPRRVEVITHTGSPRGVAGGLNALLERVDTAVVARMDADDISLPWRFRRATRAIDAGCDAVFATVWWFGSGSLRPSAPLAIYPRAMPYHLLIQNPVAHATLVARTAAVQAVQGYRTVPAEDYDLWLRLCRRDFALYRDPVPSVLSRVHGAQVTADPEWRRRARQQPGFHDSYAELTRHLLGCEPTWFHVLRGLAPADTAEAVDQLATFREAILTSTSTLPPGDLRLLRRRMTGKISSVRRRGT